MQLSTSPPVRIRRNGKAIGQTLPKLREASGVLRFGTGANSKRDPFDVMLTYRIKGNKISYSVDSTPWAIVRKGGIGVGKTPVSSMEGGTSTVFELLNPKEGLRLRITLRYSPP